MSADAAELWTVTGPECPICGTAVTGISARAPGRRTLEPCGHETGFLPAGELRDRERMHENGRILTDGGDAE